MLEKFAFGQVDRHIHALCNRKQWTGPAQFGQFLQLGLQIVFSSPAKSGFFLKMGQLATATGLDHFRYSGTATGP